MLCFVLLNPSTPQLLRSSATMRILERIFHTSKTVTPARNETSMATKCRAGILDNPKKIRPRTVSLNRKPNSMTISLFNSEVDTDLEERNEEKRNWARARERPTMIPGKRESIEVTGMLPAMFL